MAADGRLRVVYLTHCAQLSGAEIALVRLLEEVPPTDVEPIVVLAEDGPLVARLEALGAEVHVREISQRADVRKDDVSVRSIGLRTVVDWLVYTVRLTVMLRRMKADVVHTNSLKAAMYGGLAGRLARVPVVWHLHDTLTTDYLPSSALRLVRLLSRVLPSRVVLASRASRHAYESLLDARTRRRIRPVVIHDVLPTAMATDPRTTYSRISTVAMVGRLAPWKGQDVFLRAFAQVSRSHPDLHAVIAGSAMFGEDDYARELVALTDELGLTDRVELRGFVDDVPALLRDVDLLVHASVIAEPFGQVIVEGMAAGLPVIASDLGGPTEIIEPDVDGVLVAPGDPDALAAWIAKLVADPAMGERLGRAAARSAQRYRADRSVPALLDLYRTTLGRRPLAPTAASAPA